jgi:TolB-like protein
VDDVARSVVIQLSKQIGDLSEKLMIVPFTYQDTKMTSSFARYLRSGLENQIGQTAKLKWDDFSQKRGFRPKSKQIMSDLAKASGAQWLLSGTYWEQNEKIKLMATLRDVDTGKILAGADVLFDADILGSAGLSLKPENFQQALIEQNAFTEGEIVSGQLQVDVGTNRGDQNLLFTEGEIMKVYVRVNRPAYTRLLYILADGRRTLLYDNHYIDQSKVNHVVEIPEEFECAPPFGAEMLVVIARTQEFELLKTVEVDGYYYLEADSPKEAAAQARGMRKRKKQEIQQTEAKIIITTMEE